MLCRKDADRTALDTFDVVFDEPTQAVTPGQAAVVFDGEPLLDGGWIEESFGSGA